MPKLSKADKAAATTTTGVRLRKELALAEIRELEAAERAGKLIQAAAARAVWSEHNARIRDRFLSVPDRLAESLANQPVSIVRERLTAEIEDALRNLAANVI